MDNFLKGAAATGTLILKTNGVACVCAAIPSSQARYRQEITRRCPGVAIRISHGRDCVQAHLLAIMASSISSALSNCSG